MDTLYIGHRPFHLVFILFFVDKRRINAYNGMAKFDLIYAKDPKNLERCINLIDLDKTDTGKYRNPDIDSRAPWVAVDFTAQGFRPYQMYEMTAPSGRTIGPPEGRC